MSEPTAPRDPADPVEKRPETAWERKRRLARVFGDVLPEATSDDRDEPGRDDASAESASEEWLRRQVPPHHG